MRVVSEAADRPGQPVTAEQRVEQLRSLPVGWAAIVLIGLGAAAAGLMAMSGALVWNAAVFLAAVALVATLLGLAAWDFMVTALARKHAIFLALPERITLGLPRRVVPLLSPAAFFAGLIVGHLVWH